MAQRVFSAEDGNLSTSILTSRQRLHSDIDLSFTKKPSGDLYKKTDADAVKQAVKNLLLTNRNEKPFRPGFGGNLNGLLFELADDPVVRADFIDDLINQVNTYEPRARITDIITLPDPDNNSISVQVYFTIVATNEQVSIQTSISRLR